MSVPVSVVLQRKGDDVATIGAHATVAQAARALAKHGVGALVVSDDGRAVEGIISERDLARALARHGAGCGALPVSDIMTRDLATCGPDTTIDELMALMTERRIRHLPVLVDGELRGIVSIGDVVKSRLDELELQTDALERYVSEGG